MPVQALASDASLRDVTAAVKALHRMVECVQQENAALRSCLEELGVLSSERYAARLHTVRFKDFVYAHRLHADHNFQDTLEPGVAVALGCLLGPCALQRLEAASRTTCQAARVVNPYLCAIFPEHLYVAAGTDSKGRRLGTMQHFDPKRGSWQPAPPMSVARFGACAAYVGWKLCVCGGMDPKDEHLSSVEFFDPAENCWEPGPPLTEARVWAAAAVVGRSLYVCGGDGADGSCLRSVEVLDSTRGEWSAAPKMLEARSWACAATIGNRIYVCGGHGEDGLRLRSLESFRASVGVWESLAPLQIARSWASAAVLGRRLYVCGGDDDGGSSVNSVEVYSPKTGTWTRAPPMTIARAGTATAVLNGRLYACGGEAEDGPGRSRRCLNSMEVYMPEDGGWVGMPPLPASRCGSIATVARGWQAPTPSLATGCSMLLAT
eukprot:TRINITY_DN19640_c0_g1_i1.p1 TRINITY_DN19640_c0_g1~~TRINITY_DN19640_c0_g1_i1.p1  ORF type:complete len:435 (-),score=72.81 TRINITY_DN19640_c0_g1_i1:149-1453(-)